MNRGPIYVAGLERSGTSLLYALLASHPNMAMTRRTNLWTHFYNQYGDLSHTENFERCLAMMMRYKRLLILKPDPDRLRREFWQGEPTYARLFALLEEHYAERVNKPRWGDKSLNTERYADAIFAAYPSARILHAMRDPRDRYASALTRWKVSRGGIGAATAMWLSSAGLAQRHQALYPDRYLVVRYEVLVAQPEEMLRSICAFIGEEYTSDMLTLNGAETFREEGGNSSYGRRKPGVISTNSIGRYRQVLPRRKLAFMQAYAGQEMETWGYALDPIHLSPAERFLFVVGDWPVNLARLFAWRVRESMQNRLGRKVPSYRIVPEASYTHA